jgi:hypothetical protein
VVNLCRLEGRHGDGLAAILGFEDSATEIAGQRRAELGDARIVGWQGVQALGGRAIVYVKKLLPRIGAPAIGVERPDQRAEHCNARKRRQGR